MTGCLPLDVVIPGHGSTFTDYEAALKRSLTKLARAGVTPSLACLTFANDVNERYLGLTPDELAARVVRDLLAVGGLRREEGNLYPA